MLQTIVLWFIKLTPKTKRWFWKKWYTVFASQYESSDLRCMNYGYYDKEFHPPAANDLLSPDVFS